MTQAEKAKAFAELHKKGDPIILFNVWDAASARKVADAGAKALATGSHSVAEVLGYEDGEGAPFEDMLWMLERIVRSIDLPVSNDTERGYSSDPKGIAENCARVIATGAIGINIEDSFADGSLRETHAHAEILSGVKAAMEAECAGSWLNARTDVLKGADSKDESVIDAATARGRAYAEAGADSLFVPFTRNLDTLGKIAAEVPIPINAMRLIDGAPLTDYAAAGIGRVSHGPFPYMAAYDELERLAKGVY